MRIFILFILFFFIENSFSQELPPVINYSPEIYSAGNQNWMISQGAQKDIYVANGNGLLEFTGSNWHLYPVPNNTIVRSLKVVGDYIFTGAYMEFGFWKKNNLGILEYTSLLSKLENSIIDGEQIWHIENIGNIVIFQSFEGIYIYDINTNSITTIYTSANSSISNLFILDGEIYFQDLSKGLLKFENRDIEVVIPFQIINEKEIISVFKTSNQISILTRDGEFYRWNNEKLTAFNVEFSQYIQGVSIFSALSTPSNNIIIGTIENGIYELDAEGNILKNINQSNGLLNNTILSLYLDVDNNLWAGMDNGISVINLNSKFNTFQDNNGEIGSVYTSYSASDYLYLGTNQGLYFKKKGEKQYNFIPGTNGQVWSLQEIDNTIFCGHNNGTFVIEGETATKVSNRAGTWVVKDYPNSNFLIQGHYNGISFLEKSGGTYLSKPMIKDFSHSSKYIEVNNDGNIWVGNEHKGVFNIKLDSLQENILQIKNYGFPENEGITSSIFTFNDSLYYATTNQIFKYDKAEDKFSEKNELHQLIEDKTRISGTFITEGDNKIWGFSTNSIFNIKYNPLSNNYTVEDIYLPKDARIITIGHENISAINQNSYLLGVSYGYLTFSQNETSNLDFNVRLDRIYNYTLEDQPRAISLIESSEFEYKSNNISFDYNVPEFDKLVVPEYSYRLIGLSSNWSAWSSLSNVDFKNLTYGNYQFEVRARIENKISETIAYSFTILRPWYLSDLAIVLYVLLVILIFYVLHKFYKWRHSKQIEENEKALRLKNLEAEQKIIKLEKEQLEIEMVNKNKELAYSTMNLIKKNEFLNTIKGQLKESESSKVKAVIKTIDKDINEEDNWNYFKEAFNNADKDFFKKIKTNHPELTSNDLKLCAYLRLNLSSKEIAPLLNISVKSVEIKRYRLRKKMNLSREENLVDYILAI